MRAPSRRKARAELCGRQDTGRGQRVEAGRLVMRLPQGYPGRLSELGPWGFRRVSSFHCLPLGLPFLIPGSVWMTQAQAVLQLLSTTAQLSLPKFSYLEFALMGKSVQNYQGSQRDVRPISLRLRFISA